MLRCGEGPSRGLVLGLGFSTLALSCGESKSGDDGGNGGASYQTGGAAGSSPGAGGTAATNSNGGTNAAGSLSGGTSGSGAGGGGSGASSAGSSSNRACLGVTRNGRCAGNVYEWCDYFTWTIARLDCTPLGATCRALERQNYEGELNGCIAGPCTTSDASCDGAIARECEFGEVVVTDCKKYGGPGSLCVAEGTSARCTLQRCSTLNHSSCAQDLRVSCNEDGVVVIEDCARCDPAGRCMGSVSASGESSASCDRLSWGCEE